MILENKNNILEQNFNGDSQFFGIGDPVLVLDILRNRLYKNSIKVILQEYIANAFDAHIEADIKNVPIIVELPNAGKSFLTITDRGNSMTKDQINKIFTQYGVSTKRKDDTYIGGFGIGSKSAWSYTDSFNIETVTKEGNSYFKRVYCAFIDETSLGKLTILSDEEVTEEQTGTSIIIPVQDNDIIKFRSNFLDLYAFFRSPIKVNCDVIKHVVTRKKELMYYHLETNYIVVGEIAYHGDLELFMKSFPEYFDVLKEFQSEGITPILDIKDIEVSPDRANIQLSEKNLHSIIIWITKYKKYLNEYILNECQCIYDPKEFLKKVLNNNDAIKHHTNMANQIYDDIWSEKFKHITSSSFSLCKTMLSNLIVKQGILYSDNTHYLCSTPILPNIPSDNKSVFLVRKSGYYRLDSFFKSLKFLIKRVPTNIRPKVKTSSIACYRIVNSCLQPSYGHYNVKKYYILSTKNSYYLDNTLSIDYSVDKLKGLISRYSNDTIITNIKNEKLLIDAGLISYQEHINNLEKEIEKQHYCTKTNKLVYYNVISKTDINSILYNVPQMKDNPDFLNLVYLSNYVNHDDFFTLLKYEKLNKHYTYIDVRKAFDDFICKYVLLFNRYEKLTELVHHNINNHIQQYINAVYNDQIH